MKRWSSQLSLRNRLWVRAADIVAVVRSRVEMRILLGACLLVCGLGLFALLADEVLDGDTHNVDQAILLALRSPTDPTDPLGPPWFEEIMRDLTALGGIAVLSLLTLSAALYLAMARRRRLMWLLLIVAVGSIGLNALLKAGFDRPRPDLVPRGMMVYHASFPSGHAMTAASIYLTLGILVARIQTQRRHAILVMATAIIVTVLVGISRVYLAVHWPSDVLAGWIVGSVWAIACYLAYWWLHCRRDTVAEPDSPEPPPNLPTHAPSDRATPRSPQ